MGGGSLPKIPDWKVYTVGEHTPELLKTQRMLKSLGLTVSLFGLPLYDINWPKKRPYGPIINCDTLKQQVWKEIKLIKVGIMKQSWIQPSFNARRILGSATRFGGMTLGTQGSAVLKDKDCWRLWGSKDSSTDLPLLSSQQVNMEFIIKKLKKLNIVSNWRNVVWLWLNNIFRRDPVHEVPQWPRTRSWPSLELEIGFC